MAAEEDLTRGIHRQTACGGSQIGYGREPCIGGKAAGTDAAWLVRDAGIPTVLYGPGDPRLSLTPDENTELSKVMIPAMVFAELVINVLGS